MMRGYNNKGIIYMNYISTVHSTADIMTKALNNAKHSYFTNKILKDKDITLI